MSTRYRNAQRKNPNVFKTYPEKRSGYAPRQRTNMWTEVNATNPLFKTRGY